MKKARIVLLLGTVLTLTPLLAQQRLNMRLLKSDTQIFEGIVRDVIKQDFTHPYALESGPLTSYLQGYGIVVSFHLNINRANIRLPFTKSGGIETSEQRPEGSMEKQIELVKSKMIDCLADYGSSIKQLSGHDRISISAHVEDRSELDPKKNKAVIVLTALKDEIDLLAMRKISPEDFRSKLSIVQY